MDYWRWRQGLLEDKLMVVEARVTEGKVAGGGGTGYWRTSCWK